MLTAMTSAADTNDDRVMGVSRATALVMGIALVHAVLAWVIRSPGFAWGEDDAAFLLLARDLQSFHYRELQDVLAPVQARFPPVFPAMLAVVGKISGNRLDLLLAFVGLCSTVSLLFFFDAARRTIGEEVALVATSLYAVNPTALADAGNLMSEAPFKLFIALALWGAVRETEGPRYAIVAGAATVFAALTRTAGVVLIPALMLHWLLKRRYRWVFWLAVASLPVVAWLVFAFNAPDASDRRLYVADLRGRDDDPGRQALRSLRRFVPRAREYVTNFVPWTLAVPTIRGTPIDNAIWLAAAIVCGGVGLIAFARRWMMAALFMLWYGALLALWRFSFDRLVHPVVPLMLLVLLTGLAVIGKRFFPRYARGAVLGAGAVLMFGAMRRTVPEVSRHLACDRSAPAESPSCWSLPDRELLTLAHWVGIRRRRMPCSWWPRSARSSCIRGERASIRIVRCAKIRRHSRHTCDHAVSGIRC
jgi:4-amino-4-deoxy-L-arabinose transferase-like glycosyltransferase